MITTTRGILTFVSFIFAVFLPWPLTAVIVLVASLFEPFLPLAVGLFIDVLYYTPYTGVLPLFTLFGVVATVIAFFVRSRLKIGIINK